MELKVTVKDRCCKQLPTSCLLPTLLLSPQFTQYWGKIAPKERLLTGPIPLPAHLCIFNFITNSYIISKHYNKWAHLPLKELRYSGNNKTSVIFMHPQAWKSLPSLSSAEQGWKGSCHPLSLWGSKVLFLSSGRLWTPEKLSHLLL